jgi:hypothetical protein
VLMTEGKTISWIFLSIAVASQINPADYTEISIIGDGINHAVPTLKELQTSISWLIGKGLVLNHAEKYELSERGKIEFEKVRGKDIGYFQMWGTLELSLTYLINS